MTPAIPIIPYNHTFLMVELSALLAVAPRNLRALNLHDRRIGQPFDDGLDDCNEVYLDDDFDDLEEFDA